MFVYIRKSCMCNIHYHKVQTYIVDPDSIVFYFNCSEVIFKKNK